MGCPTTGKCGTPGFRDPGCSLECFPQCSTLAEGADTQLYLDSRGRFTADAGKKPRPAGAAELPKIKNFEWAGFYGNDSLCYKLLSDKPKGPIAWFLHRSNPPAPVTSSEPAPSASAGIDRIKDEADRVQRDARTVIDQVVDLFHKHPAGSIAASVAAIGALLLAGYGVKRVLSGISSRIFGGKSSGSGGEIGAESQKGPAYIVLADRAAVPADQTVTPESLRAAGQHDTIPPPPSPRPEAVAPQPPVPQPEALETPLMPRDIEPEPGRMSAVTIMDDSHGATHLERMKPSTSLLRLIEGFESSREHTAVLAHIEASRNVRITPEAARTAGLAAEKFYSETGRTLLTSTQRVLNEAAGVATERARAQHSGDVPEVTIDDVILGLERLRPTLERPRILEVMSANQTWIENEKAPGSTAYVERALATAQGLLAADGRLMPQARELRLQALRHRLETDPKFLAEMFREWNVPEVKRVRVGLETAWREANESHGVARAAETVRDTARPSSAEAPRDTMESPGNTRRRP